jgi:ribosome maturation factor RimP
MSSASALRQAVLAVLDPVVTAAGYDLEDVSVSQAGRRRLLRVIVDRDGGVDLDAVAEISREASLALDDSDVMGSTAYVLEVSSPGVDRPLTEPRHWRRNRGRLVRAPLTVGGDVTGRVVAADDEGVVLDVGGEERRLAWDEVGRGVVQVEFNRNDGEGQEAPA